MNRIGPATIGSPTSTPATACPQRRPATVDTTTSRGARNSFSSSKSTCRQSATCAVHAVPVNRYLLDNSRPEAGDRFVALAELFDPWTFRHLDDLGLGEGWRCWEVGAGGVSVPRGLAERVGTSGRVLATDIDVSWAAAAAGGALEVRRHDVLSDPPPAATFDLVHARLVRVDLNERAAAMGLMIDALRPGGWLVIEDQDPALQARACPDRRGPDEALANRLRAQMRTLMAGRGADLAYGRTLP